MRSRSEKSELPNFSSYDDILSAEVASGAAPQYEAPQPIDYDLHSPISTPQAFEAAKRDALHAKQRQMEEQRRLYHNILVPTQTAIAPGPYSPYAASGYGQAPRTSQEIEAAYRAAIAGRPQQAIAAAPAQRPASARDRSPYASPAQPTADKRGLSTKKDRPTSPVSSPLTAPEHKTLIERFREKPLQWTAGVLAVGGLVAFGVHGSSNEGSTAAALSAQPLSKELKNDSVTCPTPLADVKFTTGPNIEAHIPVNLKSAGHPNSYVKVPVGQFSIPMILSACGINTPDGKGRATWARLTNDNEYKIDRGALSLSAMPWIEQLGKKGMVPESQVLATIAATILPKPATGLTLMVDGKPASIKDYPLADDTPVIVMSSAKSKTPDMYSPAFVKELVDKLQLATIQTLEKPELCSAVIPAIDAANIAALKQQKNLGSSTPVTVDQKTAYGQASKDFSDKDTVKPMLASKVVEKIENFSMSCDAQPYVQKAPNPSNSAPPSSKPTKPAAKK